MIEDTKKEFDVLYSSSTCVWGLQADRYLAQHLDKVKRGVALDVGCGEGRHSLFLAQQGFKVDAVDISEKAVEKLTKYAEEYGVKEFITGKVGDIRSIKLGKDYDLVILSFVFPFLNRRDILTVLEKVSHSLKRGGCIYVSALTTDDVEYKMYSQNQTPLELRTYYSKGLKCACYFFEEGELKTLFSDFNIIDYTETVVELPREPYTHAMCLVFAQKVAP